jgi:hypothetical protein
MISKQRGKKKTDEPVKVHLDRLAQSGVTSLNWTAVRNYLEQHTSVMSLLPDVCGHVRQEFGAETELHLDEYRDPEINDWYLTLRLRLPKYDADTMDRIERVSESFEDRIEPTTGYLLVTTDFRPAQTANGV